MARPLKTGLDYFPHDTDASSDEKIEAMRALYGNDGYAFFFILLERIFRTPEASLDLSSPGFDKILAKKVGVRIDKFNKMLKSATDFGLFDKELLNNSKQLTSNGIRSRANIVLKHRANIRQTYSQKRGVSSEETMEEIGEVIPPETLEETHTKESKVNKSKRESKKRYGEFLNIFLTDNELLKLEERFGEREALERISAASESFSSHKDYSKKYTDHYATILSWARLDGKRNGDGHKTVGNSSDKYEAVN